LGIVSCPFAFEFMPFIDVTCPCQKALRKHGSDVSGFSFAPQAMQPCNETSLVSGGKRGLFEKAKMAL
jgi:hypothetical protein